MLHSGTTPHATTCAVETLQRLKAGSSLSPAHRSEGEEVSQASFDYVPGTGTTVTIGGQAKGTIPGADFMRALWGIWLGDQPADAKLKAGMLGGD